jgi:VanZ family protein
MANGIHAGPQPSRRRMPFVTLLTLMILALYWGAMFYGTHTRLPPGILPGNSDKYAHLGAYAGLGALLLAVRATRGNYPWSSVAGRWLVLACYGAFDELTQLLVNRNADVMDWLADIAGSALGLGIVNLFVWLFRRPSPPSEGVLALKPVD